MNASDYQNVCPTYGDVQSMQNAYSPDRLTRDQLKKLLDWNASPNITREMMVQAVKNRLALHRLTLEDVAAA